MLSFFKTYYLKKHVINLSYKLPRIKTEMTRSPLGNYKEYFDEVEALSYYEAHFISKIAPKWKVNESLFSAFELESFKEGLKALEEFRNYEDYLSGLESFYREVETLYLDIQREYATANMWARREKTTNLYEEDLTQTVGNYIKLLKDTEEYPEWNSKIKDEIGYYIHMIYTSLVSDSRFNEVFKRFDSQYFFK